MLGEPAGIRTLDLLIKSPVVFLGYQAHNASEMALNCRNTCGTCKRFTPAKENRMTDQYEPKACAAILSALIETESDDAD